MFHLTVLQGTGDDDWAVRPREFEISGRPRWDTTREQRPRIGGGGGGGASSGSCATLASNWFERRHTCRSSTQQQRWQQQQQPTGQQQQHRHQQQQQQFACRCCIGGGNVREDACGQQYDGFVNGRRQGVGRGLSDSMGDGIINPAPPGFGNRQEPLTNRFTVSSSPGSGANGDTSSPLSGRHPSSDPATIGQQRPDGRIVSGSERLRPASAPAGNDGDVSSNPPSTLMSAPANPQQWLQYFSLRQSRTASGGGGGVPTAAREPRSTLVLPLASTYRPGAGGGNGVTRGFVEQAAFPGRDHSLLSHVEGRVAAEACCPAADGPANGDCPPGATRDMLVYEVNFKRATRTFLPAKNLNHNCISCGTHMKVEADRGEDLGVLQRRLPLCEYLDAVRELKKAKAAKIAENGGAGGAGGGSDGKKKRNKAKKTEDREKVISKQQQDKRQKGTLEDEACPVKSMLRILRPANAQELQRLQEKTREEASILRVCQDKVHRRGLPMKIVDAEYQFDMHKLTLFFEAERRIDFRELVRDLFAVYKTRIWMQQVKDKDTAKKSGAPVTTPFAAVVPAAAAAAPTPAIATENDAIPAARHESVENHGVHHVGVEGRSQPPSFLAPDPASAKPDLKAHTWCSGRSDRRGGTGSGGSGNSGSSVSSNSVSSGGGSGSGDGREHSKIQGSDAFEMPWAANDVVDVVVGGNNRRSSCTGGGIAATPMAKAKSHYGRQPSQHQHRHQQHQQQSAPYSDMLRDFDIGGIADATDARTQQHAHQQQLQLQQPSESPASYPDLLEGFDGGGIAGGLVGTNAHYPTHHCDRQQEPSYPDLLQGFDFLSLA
eukprot:g13038.t1